MKKSIGIIIESKEVFAQLLLYPDSFIVQYPEPRPNNAHRWFFVEHLKSKSSWAIPNEICAYLIEMDQIVPELSDDEYRIQMALGSMDCRVYNINRVNKEKK